MSLTGAWRWVFAILLIFVTWQTLTPDPEESETGLAIARWIASLVFGDESSGDKVAHFAAYAVLGGSAAFAQLRVWGKRGVIVIALIFYGALLELGQGLTGIRQPELIDAIANMLGVAAGFPAALFFRNMMSERAPA